MVANLLRLQLTVLHCRKCTRWKGSKGRTGWAIKDEPILARRCFRVFSAALSSSERPGGGRAVWGRTAAGARYCVGSASANPDCPWFVPFPAHSYVIICDKHLGGELTYPPQRSGVLPGNSATKAACTDGRGLGCAGRLREKIQIEHTSTLSHAKICTNKTSDGSLELVLCFGAKGG